MHYIFPGWAVGHMGITKTGSFLQLLSTATFLGAAFCFGAFCLKSMYAFLALFAIGELLVFATQVYFFLPS